MARYLVRRGARLIPHALALVCVVFFLFRIVPGDPALIFATPGASADEIAAVRHNMGLDRPVLVQFGAFIANLGRGDFGVSTSFGIPVTRVLAARLPSTALLATASLGVAVTAGVSWGMLAAFRPRAVVSQLATVAVICALAVPNFWLGLLLMQWLAVKLGWLPVGGTADLSVASLPFLIMPTLAIAARLMALIMRTTRASVVETLSEDFIRTAHAKGLPARRVLWHHALRPALIPIITVVGLQMGQLLGGTVVIETLFTYQGIGLALIKAVAVRDYALIQGIVLLYAVTFLLVNLGVDVAYAYADPRIRYA